MLTVTVGGGPSFSYQLAGQLGTAVNLQSDGSGGTDVLMANAAAVATASNASVKQGQSVAASGLFAASDPDGDTIVQYAFWNTGAGGGDFVLNGVTQGINQEIDVPVAQLAQLSYHAGSGADTLWVRAFDGAQWGAWSNPFTVTGVVDSGPVATPLSANTAATHNQSFAASSLFTAGDPFSDPIITYDLWDTGSGGGRLVLNGQALAANQDNDLSAAQLAQTIYQSGAGADTLWVRASDGGEWGPWSSPLTVTGPGDPGPVATPVNPSVSAAHNQSFAASSLFTTSDPFSDPITAYDLWDTGSGGGHFVLNGQALAANQDNDLTSTQLVQTTYQSGSGADTLWVRASDGTEWGRWSNSLTVTGPIDTGPVATPVRANVTATHNQSFTASSLFAASDPIGDLITIYDLWDTGSGGGRFVLNGQALAANQHNYVTPAQLAQTTYQSGAGTDTLWVRAGDGTEWSAWSSAFTVTGPMDSGPVVTPVSGNVSAAHNQSFAVSTLFTASDPFNDPITSYDVWNTGAGGGHFVLSNQPLAANQDNYLTPAQLAQATYQSDSGADTLWVRASDGTEWGPWSTALTVTGPLDPGPAVTPLSASTTVPENQSLAASSLFTASDPFGDPITAYDVWDTGAGGGHFVSNGLMLGANQDNFLTQLSLTQTSYLAGSGTDTLWVRAGDSIASSGTIDWGPWTQPFTITGLVGHSSLGAVSANSGTAGLNQSTGLLGNYMASSFSSDGAGLQVSTALSTVRPTAVVSLDAGPVMVPYAAAST
jgi:hypothetical protein